jgi:8-oxo-dGTP pyrophosphatase MutT (NUDIX family)
MKKGKYRKALFIVVYSKEKNKIYYLILKRKLHWKGWEFPKGAINFLETRKKAVKRELKEETGLGPIKIKKFDYSGKYPYDKIYPDRPGIKGQTFVLYSVKVKKAKIRLDKIEHSSYKWASFGKALKMLKFQNQKKSLKIVDKWLKEKSH